MSVHAIPEVPAFLRSEDAGGMAMLALEAALRALGEDRPAWWLAGASGDAFKFVYDRGNVFEPLRDRAPVDAVSLACAAAGWRGRWMTGASMGEVRALVQEAVRRGAPVLAPFLGDRWYHGLVLIVGVDDARDAFLLQLARNDPAATADYEVLPIPEGWSGPVPGPAAWADNPIFVIEERTGAPGADTVFRRALALATEVHAGPPLPYANHPGADEYSGPPLAGREALQGQAALEALREDVAETEVAGFGLVWRMDAQLGQLAYDRSNAAAFVDHAAEGLEGGPATAALREAARGYRETATLAAELHRAYWDKRWSRESDRQAVRAGLMGSTSFVHGVGALEGDDMEWFRHFVPVMETAWGPAAILDGPRRRAVNTALADRILENERRCVELLGGVAI